MSKFTLRWGILATGGIAEVRGTKVSLAIGKD
jgi:hypothetical protein